MRFLHAADIHLDSPLRNLDRYEGAPVAEVRGATRRALENLVQLAIAREVDFVLLAGDLYDGDWKDYQTGLFFVAQMAKLQKAKIPVIGISGNHDAESRISKSLNQTSVVMLSPKTPVTHLLKEHNVAIHGRGFTSAAETQNVVRQYPPAVSGCFNIGLLHTSLDTDGGEHQRYAPCSVDDLRSLGYDYWALGHIHQRRIVAEQPWIVFPGNIQGRHIRETGAKGCMLVEIDSRNHASAKFEPLDVLRWEHCQIDATGSATSEDVLHQLSQHLQQLLATHDDLPLAVRVTFTGRCAAHAELSADLEGWRQQVRATAVEASAGRVWVEKVYLNTQSEAEHRPIAEGPLLLLREIFEQAAGDELLLTELATEYDELVRKLSAERVPLPTSEPQWLRQTLASVHAELFDRLQRGDHCP